MIQQTGARRAVAADVNADPDRLARLELRLAGDGLPGTWTKPMPGPLDPLVGVEATEGELGDGLPARHIANPKPKAAEIQPFASWEEIEAIAAELNPRHQAIPIFAVGTGLCPEEWIALERRDVDRHASVVHVRRVYTQGRLKECAKTSRQRRRVPLRQRILDALEALPPRLDSPLLFPAAGGGYIELNKFRWREWTPALPAAGIPHRRIYDLRHTYATWSLAAGVSLFALSRRMEPRSR